MRDSARECKNEARVFFVDLYLKNLNVTKFGYNELWFLPNHNGGDSLSLNSI